MKDTASEVDVECRKSLFGQIDAWDCSVRLYKQRKIAEIRKTFVHELIHLFCDWIRSDSLSPSDVDVDQVAELLYDTLERNNLWNHAAWANIIPTERTNDEDSKIRKI